MKIGIGELLENRMEEIMQVTAPIVAATSAMEKEPCIARCDPLKSKSHKPPGVDSGQGRLRASNARPWRLGCAPSAGRGFR